MKYKNIIISAVLLGIFAAASHLPVVRELDMAIMRTVQASRSSFLDLVFVPFIIWGSSQVTVLCFLLLSFWFYQKKDFQKAYLTLACLIVAAGVVVACKRSFAIMPPGPEFRGNFPVSWESISIRTQSSFPSGHALKASLLSVIASGWLWPGKKNKALLAALISIPIFTGFGMMYYGFHWLSDVLAGFWLALLAFSATRKISTL